MYLKILWYSCKYTNLLVFSIQEEHKTETILKEKENQNELSESESKAYAPISVNPTALTFSSAAGTKGITVTCADSGWITSAGSPAWCSMRKGSNSTATISVTKNTGGKRTTGCNCVNGSKVATVFVTQEGETVTYDRSSMIKLLKQADGSLNCAVVCAAMCVKKTIAELEAAGLNTSFAEWQEVGDAFGYSALPGSAEVGTINNVFNVLKAGYPVITKINEKVGELPHWVVVTKYVGNGAQLLYSDFTCADPISGSFVQLDKATLFSGIYRYIYYKKN